MAATLNQVRNGIANNLAAVTGVTVITQRPVKLEPPLLWVRPPDGQTFYSYEQAFGDHFGLWSMLVEGVVGNTDPAAAEADFHTLMWGTVTAAIESDKQLGGVAQDLSVTDIQNYTVSSTPEGIAICGAEWVLEIIA